MAALIVSIEEAREILGSDAEGMSDEELENVISTLDLLAKDALDQARRRISMKRDAKALAEVIHDSYRQEVSHGNDK